MQRLKILYFNLKNPLSQEVYCSFCVFFYSHSIMEAPQNWQELLQNKEKILSLQAIQVQDLLQKLQEAEERIALQHTILEKQNHAIQKSGGRLLKNNAETQEYNQELDNQRKIIEKQSKDLLDGVLYAQRIQQAMLPEITKIKEIFPDFFVFFRPRDIVSGDFYWFNNKSHRTVIASVDCTGHGVPGAFLSMIGNELLNKIVVLKNITEPDKILQQLHLELRNTLHQADNQNQEGMDVSICTIHQIPPDRQDLFGVPRVEFAGAKGTLFYIRDGQFHEIRGDKFAVGGIFSDNDEGSRRFTKHVIFLQDGTNEKKETSFYLFSDGYQDQFGGEKRKKLMIPRFREVVMEASQLPFSAQEHFFETLLLDWRGNFPQIDDVTVLGFKI